MNAFVKGVQRKTGSANANVDFFYKAGAMRGQAGAIIPVFAAAFREDKELALRNAQWLRDVRGGAGERQLFRIIFDWLEQNSPDDAIRLLKKVPEVGRWDDVLQAKTPVVRTAAFDMIGDALRARNGLAAKWMPRQGPVAVEIRKYFGMSPKFYRKSLVELTDVVEQKMCAKEFDQINFSHVPSVASSRYKKAFGKNAPTEYAAYVAALVKGDDPKVKINASAIYPHDVLKQVFGASLNKQMGQVIQAQWDALPNYMNDVSVLPLIDVSSSMSTPAGGYGSGSTVTCMQVAISLGLYCSEKTKGPFKDTFLTFTAKSELFHVKGSISEKVQQTLRAPWGGSTNIESALQEIVRVGVQNKVPQNEMPAMLLIMSDMQFNHCVSKTYTADFAKAIFEAHGYEVPKIVFWNLNDSGTTPVAFDKSGVALVSGFSPSIVKPVLEADFTAFTPEAIMKKALLIDRYNLE
jgi:hypothetical protein